MGGSNVCVVDLFFSWNTRTHSLTHSTLETSMRRLPHSRELPREYKRGFTHEDSLTTAHITRIHSLTSRGLAHSFTNSRPLVHELSLTHESSWRLTHSLLLGRTEMRCGEGGSKVGLYLCVVCAVCFGLSCVCRRACVWFVVACVVVVFRFLTSGS